MIDALIYKTGYFQLFLLTVVYFLFLYFAVGTCFRTIARTLVLKGWAHEITPGPISAAQTRFEIRHSLQSIFVFGFTGLPIIFVVRNGWVTLPEDTIITVILGLLALNCWNEIYFFVMHRLLHLPFLMRKVHYIHHRSLIPTTWSVYSFHWMEAIMLSSVPLTIFWWLPLSPLTLSLYPLTSILLNFAGHCNVRFGTGKGPALSQFGTTHNAHHAKGLQHFGFATPFVDWLYQLLKKT